jgi:hypothetical protein
MFRTQIKPLRPLLVIGLVLISVKATFAQLDLSTVAVKLGAIRTLFDKALPYRDYQYALFPELQVGGPFFTRSLDWSFYWGYWSDGVDRPLPIKDAPTYSYSSHILGVRITFLPAMAGKEMPVPVGIFAGIASHFIRARYVGGSDLMGNPGRDYSKTSTTAEIGVNAFVQLRRRLSVTAELQQYFRLESDSFGRRQTNRRAYKIGLVASL